MQTIYVRPSNDNGPGESTRRAVIVKCTKLSETKFMETPIKRAVPQSALDAMEASRTQIRRAKENVLDLMGASKSVVVVSKPYDIESELLVFKTEFKGEVLERSMKICLSRVKTFRKGLASTLREKGLSLYVNPLTADRFEFVILPSTTIAKLNGPSKRKLPPKESDK